MPVGPALVKVMSHPRLPQFIQMYGLHAAARALAYWIPNYMLYLIHRRGLFLRWRIQGKKTPSREMASHTFKEGVSGDFLGSLIVNFLFHRLLTAGRKALSKTPSSDEADQVAQGKAVVVQEQGWSGLRFDGAAPAWRTQVWQVAVAYIGYDMMFYWTHRLMHHPKLYKHVHKIHHQYHTPIGIAATHQHPMEALIQLFNWFVPIGFAGFLNRGSGGLHASTLFYYNCFRWIETVDAHCGYEFPFSPFHVLPMCWSARGHDYHHRAFDGVYGATRLWDTICGTDADFWQELADEGLLLGGVRTALKA